MVVTRAGRLREWLQGELRLYKLKTLRTQKHVIRLKRLNSPYLLRTMLGLFSNPIRSRKFFAQIQNRELMASLSKKQLIQYIDLSTVFLTFEMDQLGKIRRHHWKKHLKISKFAKCDKSDTSLASEDIAPQIQLA